MPLQTYDHAYWSIPRFKGSKARIEDVFHLWIPSAKKCHKVSKHWVRCEVNERVHPSAAARRPRAASTGGADRPPRLLNRQMDARVLARRQARLPARERAPAAHLCLLQLLVLLQARRAGRRRRLSLAHRLDRPSHGRAHGQGRAQRILSRARRGSRTSTGGGGHAYHGAASGSERRSGRHHSRQGQAARRRVEPEQLSLDRRRLIRRYVVLDFLILPLLGLTSACLPDAEDERSPTPPASTSGSRSLSITSPSLDTTRAKRKRATVSAGSTSMSFVSPAGLSA
jgi:hypothetical protein